MAAKLEWIDLDMIDDHPKNPRVVMRQDVIDAIAACLIDGFSEKHAIHVRPIDGRFQVLSGHHRKRAAEQVKLDKVPCWVEEMDDDDAFMELVTSNNQGELDPLEIGIHAFEAVPEGKRGRGNKGDGIQAYADKIGQKRPNVSNYKMAGEVAKFVYQYTNLSRLIGKALHLAAVHKMPQSCWQSAAQWVVDSGVSATDTGELVRRVVEACESVPESMDWLFPADQLFARMASTKDFSASSVESIVGLYKSALAFIKDCKTLKPEDVEAFDNWMRENVGGDSWNRRQVQTRIEELESAAERNALDLEASWCLGDFRQHIASIKDSTVSLLLTDPPYGMEYQSGRRAEKHSKIAEDGDLSAAESAVADCLELAFPKLQDNAHILVFCRWDSEHLFATQLAAAGLTVKGSLVWVKNNHGSGDLKGGFAPKHERILHAVKGSPQLHRREPDVLECDKVDTADHPTEKPLELLKTLIESTTVKNQIVLDPFGGVASTCVAAAVSGRRFFGCEIDEGYHATGKQRLIAACVGEEVEA
jgi:site-specific DNA-methyltransferase (adenine-specific)